MHDDPNIRDSDEDGEDDGRERSETPDHDPKAPFEPHEEDDSPLGDTDQHSDA